MLPPDSNIRITPPRRDRDDDYYTQRSNRTSPRSNKDFKKILDDEREGREDEASTIQEEVQNGALTRGGNVKEPRRKDSKKSPSEESSNLPSLHALAHTKHRSQQDVHRRKDEPDQNATADSLPDELFAVKKQKKPIRDDPNAIARNAATENKDDSTALIGENEDNVASKQISRKRNLENQEQEEIDGYATLAEQKLAIARKKGLDSPFKVYQNLSKNEEDEAIKGKSTQFAREQADLSYVNPYTSVTGLANAQSTNANATGRAPYIQSIINQMLESVTISEAKGKQETILKLKHPPMFEGAEVVLSSAAADSKEFNITFQNLSASAKQLLDLQQNQEDLKMGLAEKGYTLHIIVTTTQVEHFAADERREREQESDSRDQERQQDRSEDEFA